MSVYRSRGDSLYADPLQANVGTVGPSDDALGIIAGECRSTVDKLDAVPVEPGVSGFATVFANRADSSLRSRYKPSHAERMQRNDSG